MNYWQDEVSAPVVNNELSLIVPHCPVVLVLDTSHSMWGQGLVDLKNSLKEFYHSINKETFLEAQVDIETIRMGENFGIMESFTPIAASTLLNTSIRPKGDTPLGASLELAIAEIDRKTAEYRQHNICFVTPQLIVLSDGQASDDFHLVAAEIRSRTAAGQLICRAIALGCNPNHKTLEEFAGNTVVLPEHNNLPEAFREVGCIVSQEYEASAAETIVNLPGAMSAASHDMFLLDGTNILYWDEIRNGISMKYVMLITDYLRKEGKEFVVYFDASTPYTLRRNSSADEALYSTLLKNDPEHFRQVPAGTRADDILLIEADQNAQALILSNDRYHDYEVQYPWLSDKKRIIPGMVLSDKIVFPKIKLSIPVSCLGKQL